ncbi:hypothetical protein SASPL_143298 [Salvia splendens]|uniref:SnoaL-like domain-containing protein n=1 Tax=Salvia splendens TaxID=180675 RepID=A0A8X8WND5_SALSN|nr:hypothetical protein SASPL_143298 [Salvia splendens]
MIVKDRSHTAMSQFWLKAGYVKCFNATGESFTGYNQVMESWRATFRQENANNFQIRDVRTHVLTDMAWVTMKAYSNMERAYNVTNIYELCNGRWQQDPSELGDLRHSVCVDGQNGIHSHERRSVLVSGGLGMNLMSMIDFSLEQGKVKPANGWKAYYAATLAIVNINAEFFRIVKERSHTAMSQVWLNAGYWRVIYWVCIYNQVMESWRATFSWESANNFQIRDVRTHVLTNMAWVTMKAYSNMERAYNVTNIYELCNGMWYMVHHHSLAALIHEVADQQFV